MTPPPPRYRVVERRVVRTIAGLDLVRLTIDPPARDGPALYEVAGRRFRRRWQALAHLHDTIRLQETTPL
jgi:hypothetical protein